MDNQPVVIQPGQSPQPQINQQPQVPTPIVPQRTKRSRVFLLWILIIILIAALAGVYLWQHNKVSNLQSQLTAANNKVSISNTKLANSSKQYLYLYKFGVKIPLSSSISSLYYVDLSKFGYDTLSFSTQSLGSTSPTCWATPTDYYYTYQSLVPGQSPSATSFGPSPFLDLIIASTKSLSGSQLEATNHLLGHINGYYFYAIQQNGMSGCSSNNVSQQNTAFTAAIKDIQPIN